MLPANLPQITPNRETAFAKEPGRPPRPPLRVRRDIRRVRRFDIDQARLLSDLLDTPGLHSWRPRRVPAFGAVFCRQGTKGKVMPVFLRRWTPQEERRLLAMIAEGKRGEVIAAELGRSVAAVYARAYHSQIRLKRDRARPPSSKPVVDAP